MTRSLTDPATLPAIPSASEPAIQAEGITRSFKGHVAVDGINLTVAPGEIYGFLGPNGAGKSTTVLMLSTLLPPTTGRATVGGYDIITKARDVRKVIGVALQDVALDEMLTGREHLRFQATLRGLDRASAIRRTDQLLERVALTEAAGHHISTYSGGMRRRLDLALALVHRPRILFLDEPTAGLDPASRTSLWTEVNHLAKDEGVAVFLTTQYLEEADALADRVAIIDHGRIVGEGTPEALKAGLARTTAHITPADSSARGEFILALELLGPVTVAREGHLILALPRGDADLADVVRTLDHAHLTIGTLSVHRPTLDDVYLSLTGHRTSHPRDEGSHA